MKTTTTDTCLCDEQINPVLLSMIRMLSLYCEYPEHNPLRPQRNQPITMPHCMEQLCIFPLSTLPCPCFENNINNNHTTEHRSKTQFCNC